MFWSVPTKRQGKLGLTVPTELAQSSCMFYIPSKVKSRRRLVPYVYQSSPVAHPTQYYAQISSSQMIHNRVVQNSDKLVTVRVLREIMFLHLSVLSRGGGSQSGPWAFPRGEGYPSLWSLILSQGRREESRWWEWKGREEGERKGGEGGIQSGPRAGVSPPPWTGPGQEHPLPLPRQDYIPGEDHDMVPLPLKPPSHQTWHTTDRIPHR